MFDYAVLPGRFQPPHAGHLALIRHGLTQATRVIVACGEVDLSRSILRPWSFAERKALLRRALPADLSDRVAIIGVRDNPYRPRRWVETLVTQVASSIAGDGADPANASVALLTGAPGSSPLRPSLFPGWPLIECERDRRWAAASLRAAVLGSATQASANTADDAEFVEALSTTLDSRVLDDLRREFAANETFRARWATAPWPPVFVTVDALVVAEAHVLLVERGRFPGRGLQALPGGFLDPDETLRAACLRELAEETAIDCDSAMLSDSLSAIEVFDAPDRSARGRTITHAHRFDLAGPRPAVRGGDDAAAAHWVALDDVRRDALFEDHYAILQAMLGIE